MADPIGTRVTLTLALDLTHWRRHDRAFWTQTLAAAANEAAPHIMHVESYELSDTLLTLRMRSSRTPKALRKLWRDDEIFMRLRARLVDLGAHSEFDVEEEPD